MRTKMAVGPHTRSVSVLFIVTFLCFFVFISATDSYENTYSEHTLRNRRLRRQVQVTYDQELRQGQVFPEDTADNTVFYDFKSVTINGESAATYSLKVITNDDSVPPTNSDIFELDSNSNLIFSASIPREERRKNYFDYEQYPKMIVIIEASPVNTNEGKKYLKLHLELKDVNDEFPVFKNQPNPYYAAIPVESRQDDTVYILLAEDPDGDTDIRYGIDVDQLGADSNIENIFRMDEVIDDSGIKQGHLKIAAETVFNRGDNFMIPVYVEDRRGVLPQRITASVDVLVGPRPPQFFQSSYEGTIFESKKADNLVLSGSADELIVKVHQFQNYPIVLRLLKENGDESTAFRIEENGKIYNTEGLDFDIEKISRPPTYKLKVKVIETSDDSTVLENTVSLVITVKDENDNPPRFQLTQYLKTIDEDAQPDEFVLSVLAEDNDSGKNAEIDYELVNDYFRIEKRMENGKAFGDIFVKSGLDYDKEEGPIYRFFVTAKDNGSPPQTSVVNIFVTTRNVNDESPVIQTQDSIVLRADVSVSGTQKFVLTRMRANDKDGDNINFYFSSPGTGPNTGSRLTRVGIFEITPATGIIEVIKEVPASKDSYYLNVTAVDDGSCCGGLTEKSSKTSFVVEIVDAVNQKPVFEKCLEYNDLAKSTEESEKGTPVIKVLATDNGRGVNGIVEYSIESPNPEQPDAPFSINKVTGQITINSPIDREPDTNYKQITIVAADKAVPPQKGWCTFRVTILDINDNAPLFDKTYTAEIPKNAQPGRVITRVGALDKDIQQNAAITYSLTSDGNGVFGIYNDTGLIYIKNPFTPGVTEYDLVVMAQDNGNPRKDSSVGVEILISRQEDTKPPVFQPDAKEYVESVAETVNLNHLVKTLECTSNNPSDLRVQFFLVSSNGELFPRALGKFTIRSYEDGDRHMVDIRVTSNLDYETERQHKIIVRCQDFAALTMFVEMSLTINVVDKNDKIPYFAGVVTTTGRYVGSVPENIQNGKVETVIDNIQGYDDDASEEFRRLHFSLKESEYSNLFAIEDLPGNKAKITTSYSFDREEKDRYYLTVIIDDIEASDIVGMLGNPNTATAIVEVNIGDENDNAMVFKQDLYPHSVKETANIGELIFPVTADDEDEVDQGRLKYRFLSKQLIPFDIRDQTGDIFVTNKLDYESGQKEYRLTLESYDNLNKFSATTTVLITVTDENDNVPVFKDDYVITNIVEEDSSATKQTPIKLTTVTATDADVSRNETRIRYSLLGKGTEPGDQQIFTINGETGEIHLVATLDRDINPEYIFTVEAIDEDIDPQKGYVNVKVLPIDINDNKPRFDRKTLRDSVREGTEKDKFITQVKATDLDFGRNAQIRYEIVQGPADIQDGLGFFRVNPDGTIYSQVPGEMLDREKFPEFKITVRATDNGTNPLSANATLVIELIDENDNKPKFLQKSYNVRMSENYEITTIIKEVVATDKDIGKNAALRYILPPESNQKNKHFAVTYNNNKGYITLTNTVDYEIESERHFMLTVRVMDNNVNNFDTATINITVEDFNDEVPKFSPAFVEREIREGMSPGLSVANFTATDADSGMNAEKTYEIDRKTDPRREFYIDPITGEVTTRKTLDREVSPTLNILIMAIDKGDPQLTGTATLSVRVIDINDNYPIFKKDYRPVVMENNRKGPFPLFVEEIFAIDLDSLKFGPKFGFALPDPCNEIACNNFNLTFEPNRDGGNGTAVITTNRVFDREVRKEYHLPIVMSDMRGSGSPDAQTGTNTLTIVIGDVNDNEPFPGHQDIFVQNFEGMFPAFVIGRVYVKDQDDWDLPDKTFTFQSPASLSESFTVDKGTGDITMKKGVKANFGGEPYQFRVSVYDKVFKKTVSSTVSVIVKELTEEAVMKSGSVRLAGITAAQFIQTSTNPTTGASEDSLYTKFRLLMADKLNYPSEDNVEITTLRDGPDYLEVRYAAHGSPYLTPAQVDNVIIMNKAEFEAIGISIMTIPVDECQDEIFEGGCYNKLNITGKPVTTNANGTSYVGVEAFLVATEGCQADQFPATEDCTGDYCYNGGQCNKDDWGTLSCSNCPKGFTGARCQERRHSFDGNAVAFYKTLLQCEESQTSIEFATMEKGGVLFYNGPMAKFDPLKTPQDFILLKLEGGYPVLMIDHGTGILTLKLDGKDKQGTQLIPKTLSDGEWHHIDINRFGKTVELVVDRCKAAKAENGRVVDDRACRVKGETPGVNNYLNVNTLLQLGGVKLFETDIDHLDGVSLPGFQGCVRNFIHNKELYNLNYHAQKGINTGTNGCPFEDDACGVTDNKPVCGIHGQCQATMRGYQTCICHSGYYGNACGKRVTTRDFWKDEQSYYYWEMKGKLYNNMTESRELTTHLRFRTRQTSGNLMYLHDPSQNPSQNIQLLLFEGKVRLTYNLGGGPKNLDLTYAQANNGQWHTLTLARYGTEFHLRLDGGEGRNYAFVLGNDPLERPVFRTSREVYSGGYKTEVNGRMMLKENLKSTCIEDVRVNNGYFAMTTVENDADDTYATVKENPGTREGCEREDCTASTCPAGRTCVELWERSQCRCNPGFYKSNSQCVSICSPNPCYRNVTCRVKDNEISCLCEAGWRGRLCNELNPEEVSSAGFSNGALVAIIAALLLVILVIVLVIFLYKRCGAGEEGEKYILEVDPEDDIRENVMNYDEEGAGEEDQDAYDISRLQKPNFETPYRPYDPDKRRDVNRRNAPGDKPDVGIFIDDRLKDADDDGGAPPHDSVREFTFEGGESDAGSLSSLNTSSSDRSQDYDYLNEWGPKFAKLADMYGAGQDLDS